MMEQLATLCRRAENPMRDSPECLYQDADSAHLRGGAESRRLVSDYERDVGEACRRFGVPTSKSMKEREEP